MATDKIFVVIKMGNDWLVGETDFKTFKANKKVKRLKDVKDVVETTTLKKYLKGKKQEDKFDKILENLKASSVYVMDKPMYQESEDVVDNWWKHFNVKCKRCSLDCKQSIKVKVVKCPQYKTKN